MLSQFASDNYAPVHPLVIQAIQEANEEYAPAYAKDLWTENLDERIEEIFGWGSLAFPVLNGTGANVIGLMSGSQRWGGVIATDIAHINTDENGAPERVGGLKLLTVKAGQDGKLKPEDLERWHHDVGDVHRAQPRLVSITQATEVGTVYHPEELRELCETAHDLGFGVHMDGARLVNAAAYLGTGLRDQVTEVGVDILSLGAAKNGGMLGEAVVVLGPNEATTVASAEVRRLAAAAIPYLRKSTMQLASKSRFISAQLLALLGDPARVAGVQVPLDQRLWLKNARHANAMAQKLRLGVESLGSDEVKVTRVTEANAVFATLPREVAERLRGKVPFYDWADGETPDRVEVRWMCSWCTTEQEVESFLKHLAAAL